MSDLTETEEYNHNLIVEHNAQLVDNKPVEYPEDYDLMEALANDLYNVPIKYDLDTGTYYQEVEFENGEEVVVIDSKYYDIINKFI
mgnify:CR=1 FL=1